MSEETVPARPLLRVVRGTPDAYELAALAAVFAAVASSADATPPPKRGSLWADPSTRLRPPVHHGPGAWRASGLPR